MLESLHSKQVAQTYLANEFPLTKETSHDRLFKHITFPEEQSNETYRLTPVDHNHHIQSNILVQKKVTTKWQGDNLNQEKFRLKAVLSEEDSGQLESFWVMDRTLQPNESSSYNQYRIRGVSDKNWKGDWVYSELRDEDNDLIIFNMLHDVLDLMLSVHDKELEYLLDHMVGDTFANIIKDRYPDLTKVLSIEEAKEYAMSEMLSLLSSEDNQENDEKFVTQLAETFELLSGEITKEFKESFYYSKDDFVDLMRLYKVDSHYLESNKDFLSLIVEIFLEEKYDKIVEKTDIEVLLQNEEETGVYLSSSYDFDIKRELISSLYNTSPSDHFVTNLDDAVQLIVDPVVIEELRYGEKETVEKLLRLMMMDIYAPMQAIDQYLIETHTDIEDTHYMDINDNVLEMYTDSERGPIRHMILADIIKSVIKGDKIEQEEYYLDFIEKMVDSIIDKNVNVLIDYHFDEILQVLLGIGESFQKGYIQAIQDKKESKQASLYDEVHHVDRVRKNPIKEKFYASVKEMKSLKLARKDDNFSFNTTVNLIDSLEHHYHQFKNIVSESIQSSMEEMRHLQDNRNLYSFVDKLHSQYQERVHSDFVHKFFVSEEYKEMLLQDISNLIKTVWNEQISDHLSSSAEDSYYNLYRNYLSHPNKFPVLEAKVILAQHNLNDNFIMEGKDIVQYALGEMGDGWTIGTFRLGVNTLKGES